MDELRNQLKTMNRQFGFYMKHKTAMKNNLISILDQTYPGVNTYFDSPARSDGCLLYTSPSPRDGATSRMPSSA